MMTITDTTCAYHDTIGGACSRESNTLRYGHHTPHQHACVDNFLDAGARHGLGKRDLVVEHQLVHERAGRRRRHARHRRRHLGARPLRRRARRDGRARADLQLPADQQPVQRLRPDAGPRRRRRTGRRDARRRRSPTRRRVAVAGGRRDRGARRRPVHHGAGPARAPRLLARRGAAERADGRPLATGWSTAVVGNADAAPRRSSSPAPGRRCASPADAVVAIGGAAMAMTVDGRAVAAVDAGRGAGRRDRRASAPSSGPGLRADAGGARRVRRAEPYLGSRSTFTLGGFGGHEGRALVAGDVLADRRRRRRPTPAPLPPGHGAGARRTTWELGVLDRPAHRAGVPHRRPGSTPSCGAEWGVHFNSARTGVRLIGPRPRWARPDGGEAGLHPSNIHDTGYAIGAVDLTGDMPVILGPDGPSLGGFVCPAVVAAARAVEARPAGARATACGSCRGRRRRRRPRRRAARRRGSPGPPTPIEPVARPVVERAPVPRPTRPVADDAVLARRRGRPATRPAVTYRRAGDRFLLVEYGPMALDLALRLRVHAPRPVGRASTSDRASSTPPPASARCSSRSTASGSPSRRRSARCRGGRGRARRRRQRRAVRRRGSCTCRCRGTTRRPARRSSATCTACAPTRRGARGTSSSSAASTASTTSTTSAASSSTPRTSCSASATSTSARRSPRRSIPATASSRRSTTRRARGRRRTPSASAAPTSASTAWRAPAATSSSGARCRCGTATPPGPHFDRAVAAATVRPAPLVTR